MHPIKTSIILAGLAVSGIVHAPKTEVVHKCGDVACCYSYPPPFNSTNCCKSDADPCPVQ